MGVDTSSLPPDIQAMIAEAVAAALKAAEPPPPRELTPGERAAVQLATIAQLERGDKSLASGSGPTHQAILDLLTILVAAVFPARAEQAVETGGAS